MPSPQLLNLWGKAGWLILVIVLPYIGVLIYVIVRGRSMSKRETDAAQERTDAFKEYVRDAAGSGGGSADELAKLAELKDKGALTETEFQKAKEKLLA